MGGTSLENLPGHVGGVNFLLDVMGVIGGFG